MRKTTLIAAVLVLPLSGGHTPAAESPEILPSSDAMGSGATLSLSLEDALRLMLERNLDLELARYFPKLRREDVQFERGAYDPTLSAFISNVDAETQLNTQMRAIFQSDSMDMRDMNYGASLGTRFVTGAQAEVGLDMKREDLDTSLFRTEEHTARAYLSLTQPLLRGAGFQYNTAQIRIAEKEEEASRLEFKDRIEEMLAATEKAYWGNVYSQRLVEIARESLGLASSQLNLSQTRYQAGAGLRVDVLEAQAALAARTADLLRSQNVAEDAADVLRALLRLTTAPFMWSSSIVLTTTPEVTGEGPSLKTCIDTALQNRPDYLAAQLHLEAEDIRVSARSNETLPQTDLFAGVATTGLEDRPHEALETAGHLDFPEYTVGLLFSYPLGNRSALALRRRAEISRDQLEVSILRLEDEIVREVREAWRQLHTEVPRMEATRESERLAEEKLADQQRRYEVGRATGHEVFQFQEDLTRARVSVVGAQVRYLEALVDLYRTMGALAEYRSVLVE